MKIPTHHDIALLKYYLLVRQRVFGSQSNQTLFSNSGIPDPALGSVFNVELEYLFTCQRNLLKFCKDTNFCVMAFFNFS